MVLKHILMTLAVGGGITALVAQLAPPPWSAVQIWWLCLTSIAFILWTVAHFQLGASFAVQAQAKQLITRGLYSKIRNPIYVFSSCLIASVILLLRRPVWLLIFAVIIPVQMWRAHKEAQVLEGKFGEEYRTYRAGTWF
jgi:protein-S-isoprenylcysteine O-methyltransferase Ste14